MPLTYHLAALFIMLMTVLIVYFDTFRSMVETWLRSDTYLHGFIILPISVYLVWRRWPLLKTIPLRPTFLGAWLLLGVSIVWFFSDVLGIQVGKHFAATAMIPAAVIALMGGSFARAIVFPLGYLIFAVPFGEFWVPQLMEITADFAVGLLQVSGIPVLRDGLFLSIPVGNFEVAEACSGIRYVLATLALGTLYAYSHYERTYKRVIFIIFSLLLPVVANGVRAYGIIAIAYYSDMKYAVGVDHLIYGWIFFGVVIGLMFLVGSRYRDETPSENVSLSHDVRDADSIKLGRLVFVTLAVATATISGPMVGHALAGKLTQESEFSNGLPNVVVGWHGMVLQDPDWVPSFIGATQKLLVRYRRSGVDVDVALVRYHGQQQGSELANESNSIFGNNGWQRRNTRTIDMNFANGSSFQLFESRAVKNGSARRFWYWYEVNGSKASGAKIKLYEAHSLLKGNPAISSAVIISFVENGSKPNTLKTFLDDAYAGISECMIATEPQKECDLGLLPAPSELERQER